MANVLQTEGKVLDLGQPVLDGAQELEVAEAPKTRNSKGLEYDREARASYLSAVVNENGEADTTLLGADSELLEFRGCIFDNYHMGDAVINGQKDVKRGDIVGYRFRWNGNDPLAVSQSTVKDSKNAYQDSKFTDPENTPTLVLNKGDEAVLSRLDAAILLSQPRFNGSANGGVIREAVAQAKGEDFGATVTLVIKVSANDKFGAKNLGTPSLSVSFPNQTTFKKGESLQLGDLGALKHYGESIAQVPTLETQAIAGETPIKPEYQERFGTLALPRVKKAKVKDGSKDVQVNRSAMRLNYILQEKGISVEAPTKKAPKKAK